MLDDSDSPALEVGFAIDGTGAVEELMRLQSVMDSTEGRLIADAAKIEQATRGMVNVAGASAAVTAFGNAATPALRAVAQEAARVEKAGERMVVQLERQNASFGKTRTELQSLRAEELATAAARAGNADLAERLRAAELAGYSQRLEAARKLRFEQEAAAQDAEAEAARRIAAAQAEARAIRDAAIGPVLFEQAAKRQTQANREAEAAATAKAADEHARLAAAVRGSHDAQMADAAAAERLRETTDPLYAATKRLNAEIAESTRLYHAGATAPAEYARQQEVLTGRIRALGKENEEAAKKVGKNNFALRQTALQLPDIISGLATGQKPMGGAKSAADVLSEQQDLQNQLLQLTGDTAAIRAAELAKLDPSNRALQSQIYAIQDAQDAAKAAADLRDAWKSVGDTIMDEIKRIRGLSDTTGAGTFASLMGQFNAANSAARAGDQDAAKSLPTLSKSLLDAAALAATSRQELDRVQAQTAATLEATYAVVSGLATDPTKATAGAATSAAASAATASSSTSTQDATATAIQELREELAETRADLNAALATIAGSTGAMRRKLDDVTAASGGDAISVAAAA